MTAHDIERLVSATAAYAVFHITEEAEYIIGMAADWIELDSPDVWVRLDSELVRDNWLPMPRVPPAKCSF